MTNSTTLPACHILRLISVDAYPPYRINGVIVSEPIVKNNKTTFRFRTQQIISRGLRISCCGDILVYARGKRDFTYAERLSIGGTLHRPFGNRRQGGRSYKTYLANQGIFLILEATRSPQVVKLGEDRRFLLNKFSFWLKKKIENIFFQHLPLVPASILDAMVLGEKRYVPGLIYDSMVKLGTVHILVVSGFNVGIVAFIVVLFLRLLRLPRKTRIYIAIPLLIIYCLMTGASNPVVRSTIMAILVLSSYLLKREPDIYNSLAVAALFILLINPRQLFDIGFQLSFASVISIVCIYPKMKEALRISVLKNKYLRYVIEGCLVSFSAWLGTMGLIAYYFKFFSPITVLANIFIVPLATLITLCGFSLIFSELVFPVLTPFFATSSGLIALFLLKINLLMFKAPFAYIRLP